MVITHHPNFPAEAAQLVDACCKVSNGLTMENVVMGAMEFLSLAIVHHAKSRGLTKKQAITNARALGKACAQSVDDNWNRPAQPEDLHIVRQ